jgi:hypothetical protein
MCAIFPAHIIPIIIGRQRKSWETLLYSFPELLIVSSPSQHSVLKHPQSIFFPQSQKQNFASIQNRRQKYSLAYFNFFLFRCPTRRHNVLDGPLKELSEYILHLISPWFQFRLVTVVLHHLNFASFSKDVLAIFMLWSCLAFWWRDSKVTWVFFCVNSRQISLLASIIVESALFVFFFLVISYRFTSSAYTRSWYVGLTWISWNFVAAFSKQNWINILSMKCIRGVIIYAGAATVKTY